MAKSIPQEEWDFSNCSTDEAHECLAWELARESELVITDVKTLRKGVKGETFETYLDHIGMGIFEGMRGRTMNSFYFCPEFPEQPYLSVPDKERKQRLTKLWGLESEAMARMLDARNALLPQDIRRRFANAAKPGEPVSLTGTTELAMLNINWRYTNNMLINSFRAWLIKNRPSEIEQLKQGRGVPATQAKKQLKAIGALRLLRVKNYVRAALETDKLMGKALYLGQSEWIKAENKALKMVDALVRWETKRTA